MFIEVYEDVFTKEYCDSVIELMEISFLNGYGYNRQSMGISKHYIDDIAIHSNEINAGFVLPTSAHNEFISKYQMCYEEYASKYSILEKMQHHSINGQKLQKTHVGGGYHNWHHEACDRNSMHRVLAFTLYLNDIEEGGETEFLYQSLRIKPKAGTLVIFPTGFSFTHRGNPPLSGTKYISTGWMEF